jgi:hypothetical protein
MIATTRGFAGLATVSTPTIGNVLDRRSVLPRSHSQKYLPFCAALSGLVDSPDICLWRQTFYTQFA